MEMQLDIKDLNKPCQCGSGKLAGYCCKKNEPCPCGSERKACNCCFRSEEKDAAKK